MNSLFTISGKCGFITGAAGGIGTDLATHFAKSGANLALVDINFVKAEKLAQQLKQDYDIEAIAIACDVTASASVTKMIEEYKKTFAQLDFAVNNAGVANIIKAIDITQEDFKKVIDINLNGVFLTAQAAARMMKEQETGGSIVNTASMSASVINTPQTIANYCASKGGVKMLTKALAVEWAEHNIRVNSVSPGYIATELVAQMTDFHENWKSKIPMKRLGSPEDLLGIYTYLIGDSSKYMTGSDLIIDGGYTSL